MEVADQLTELADVDQPTRPDALEQPGSRAALGKRAERLPPEHPSSPAYDGRPGRREGDGNGASSSGQPESLPGSQPDGPEDSQPDPPLNSRPPDREKPDYWSLVPVFLAMWREHEQRWPPKQGSAADMQRAGDPPGSWRGDGDRYLSPEQNAHADRLIVELQKPEQSITAQLQRIEQENPNGGTLVGLEHRLKGTDRLKEKIADGLDKEVGSTVTDAVAGICDAVRYTFCFSSDDYALGCREVCERLSTLGYEKVYRENHWPEDPHYKGINTRWATPQGDRFELQFHTPESAHAKEHLTHVTYERLRTPGTSRPERRELLAFESIVSAAVPTPAGDLMMLDE